MKNETITITADDMAKLIAVQIAGAMLVMAHRQLRPSDMCAIKDAVKMDIERGSYTQAFEVFATMTAGQSAN